MLIKTENNKDFNRKKQNISAQPSDFWLPLKTLRRIFFLKVEQNEKMIKHNLAT